LNLSPKLYPLQLLPLRLQKFLRSKSRRKKKFCDLQKKKKFAWLFAEKKESVDPPHISAAQFSALCVGGHFPLDSLKKSQKKKGSLF